MPVVKTSSSSPIPSPNKLFTPSSPAKSLTSPVRYGLDSPTKGNSIIPTASAGQKPPIKRSISNTRVFVNINGSPVKIPKPRSSSSSQGTDKTKQRSIQDLFRSTDRKSVSQSSIANTDTKRDSLSSPKSTESATSASSLFPKHQSSSSTSNPKSSHSKFPPVSSTESSSAEPTQSRYFNGSNCDGMLGAGGAGQRKRQRDDSGSSASIFDFFQKTLASESTARRESIKTKSPAMQHRTATSTTTSSSTSPASLHSSAGLHSVTSSSSSSSSSSTLTVSCPVCQAKVQESKINEHLDSCLS